MANGLFNLKQVMQGIQQGGWVNQVGASTYGAYFGGSGSGQYLLGPTTSALNFSTGSFTVEFWAFISAYGGGDLTIMFSASNASADFQFGASASSGVYWHNSGNQLTSNATAVPLGKWVHMALVRSGTTASLFCNGIRYSTATNSAAVNLTNFNIGSYQGAPSAYMTKGWISNLRITNTAVYDPTATTLTLPLSNLTAISGTQLLTLQNATIIDNSTNALTITNNGSVAMQTVTPFGLSNYKPPAVEYLVVAGGGGTLSYGGGGGAGGLLQGIAPVPNGQTLLVTVGGGGSIGANNGSNSVFGPVTAIGGGFGSNSSTSGGTGGSGGGGGGLNDSTTTRGGQGTSGQGNAGGLHPADAGPTSGYKGAGGGGGAGTVGLDGYSLRGGNGGAGITSAISGTVTAYAGGGGGSGYDAGGPVAAGVGGVGGGGNGGYGGAGSAGTANTGGGGGGGTPGGSGFAGGSGIVIVSYPDTYAAASAVTGATVSTSGSGSVSFSGSSQYLVSGTSSNFSLGTSDFSVECWVYKTSSVSDQAAVASSVTGNLDPLFFYFSNGSNNALLYLSSNGSTFDIASAVAVGTVSLNTWAHLAVTRVGTTFTTYLNGTQTSTFTSSASIYKSVNSYAIGAGQTSINGFKGYISNVRVLKGSSAYSSAFTPSTTPLTPITNTVLLVNTVSGAPFADSSTTSTTFTATGSPAWNASSPFTVTGYKNRVYTWTSSGSITF